MPNNEEESVQRNDIPVIYVDVFRIGYDAYKFVLDVGPIPSNSTTPEFRVRTCMGPNSAKAFTEMFRRSIQEYDDQYGRKCEELK